MKWIIIWNNTAAKCPWNRSFFSRDLALHTEECSCQLLSTQRSLLLEEGAHASVACESYIVRQFELKFWEIRKKNCQNKVRSKWYWLKNDDVGRFFVGNSCVFPFKSVNFIVQYFLYSVDCHRNLVDCEWNPSPNKIEAQAFKCFQLKISASKSNFHVKNTKFCGPVRKICLRKANKSKNISTHSKGIFYCVYMESRLL